MQKLLSAFVAALCVVCALGQNSSVIPCVGPDYITPGFDAINFVEITGYHDHLNGVSLFKTNKAVEEYRVVDLAMGIVYYANFETDICYKYKSDDSSFSIMQLQAGAQYSWSVDDYAPFWVNAYEMAANGIEMRVLQNADTCADVFYYLARNGVPRLMYFYSGELPATREDVKIVEDVITQLRANPDCELRD